MARANSLAHRCRRCLQRTCARTAIGQSCRPSRPSGAIIAKFRTRLGGCVDVIGQRRHHLGRPRQNMHRWGMFVPTFDDEASIECPDRRDCQAHEHVREVTRRAETVQQRCNDDRPNDGAYAMNDQHSACNFDERDVGIVAGVGDTQRIDRHCGRADEEDRYVE